MAVEVRERRVIGYSKNEDSEMSSRVQRSDNQSAPASGGALRMSDAGHRTTKQRPLKGAAGAEQASAAQLDAAVQKDRATASESSAFLITRRNSAFVEAPIFRAGEDGSEEAVAVFTEKQAAQDYVDQADWNSTSEVAALSSKELNEWLMEAHQQGVSYAAVNPDRRSHLAGDPQPVLLLDGLNDDSDESLARQLKAFAGDRSAT